MPANRPPALYPDTFDFVVAVIFKKILELWVNGRDVKQGCDASAICVYHPDNPDKLKNKCNLRNGAIWKRENPDSPFSYGKNYLEVIKDQLLGKKKIPLKDLLAVFYTNDAYDEAAQKKFMTDFHLTQKEYELFFDYKATQVDLTSYKPEVAKAKALDWSVAALSKKPYFFEELFQTIENCYGGDR